MWRFTFIVAYSQIDLLSIFSVAQPWYWGEKKHPTMVILLNSYWSPGLHLIFWKHHVPLFLKLNFTAFLFHRKLINPFYAYLKLLFKLLKISTEGESCYSSKLRFDFHLTVTEILRVDVAGDIVATTTLLGNHCFYCCIKYNVFWGLLAQGLWRLVQWRLTAESVWPFLKLFARRRTVLQTLIRYCCVLPLQDGFEAQQQQQQKKLVFSTFRRCYCLGNLATDIFRAFKKPTPENPNL